jgi:hypothetical protein
MNPILSGLGFLAAAVCVMVPGTRAQDNSWVPIQRDELCVTTGAIERTADGLSIDGPEVRATLRKATAQAVELRFTYLGPSEATAPLASGEHRRQIGIKFRARDTCNVVYVMWHIAPDTKIEIAVKRNPAMHSHAECGDRGYINMEPPAAVMPPIGPGSTHILRGILRGNSLEVYADNTLAFNGSLARGLLDFDGPVGLRTDNARFRLTYLAGGREFGPPAPPLDPKYNHCH